MTTFTTQDRLDAQRAPLTKEQITNIATPFLNVKFEINSPTPRFDVITFARAIERAHGIGE